MGNKDKEPQNSGEGATGEGAESEDKTRVSKAKRTLEIKRIRYRIKLENRDLLILDISLENPQGWKASV